MPLASGQVGVYARYAAWQMRCHVWAKDDENGPWDIGHHVSWGSLSHPVGLAGGDYPLVIGPVGGGQSLERRMINVGSTAIPSMIGAERRHSVGSSR